MFVIFHTPLPSACCFSFHGMCALGRGVARLLSPGTAAPSWRSHLPHSPRAPSFTAFLLSRVLARVAPGLSSFASLAILLLSSGELSHHAGFLGLFLSRHSDFPPLLSSPPVALPIVVRLPSFRGSFCTGFPHLPFFPLLPDSRLVFTHVAPAPFECLLFLAPWLLNLFFCRLAFFCGTLFPFRCGLPPPSFPPPLEAPLPTSAFTLLFCSCFPRLLPTLFSSSIQFGRHLLFSSHPTPDAWLSHFFLVRLCCRLCCARFPCYHGSAALRAALLCSTLLRLLTC